MNRLWELRLVEKPGDLAQFGVIHLHHLQAKAHNGDEHANKIEAVLFEMQARIEDLTLQRDRGLPNRTGWPPIPKR